MLLQEEVGQIYKAAQSFALTDMSEGNVLRYMATALKNYKKLIKYTVCKEAGFQEVSMRSILMWINPMHHGFFNDAYPELVGRLEA